MADEIMERLKQLSEPGAILDPDLIVRIFDMLPNAVIVIDDQGVMRLVNQAAELIFGYPRQNMLGQKLEMLLPERFRERHAEHRRRFFEEPRTRPMGVGISQLLGLHRNGSEIALDITIGPLVADHGIYGVAVVRRRQEHGSH